MADCSARNAILLEGTFTIYPKTTVECNVRITNSEISYIPCVNHDVQSSSRKVLEHVINFSDVIGVDCMRGKAADSTVAYLNVYAYPRRKKFASESRLRKRHCVTFTFSHCSSFEENHRDAMQWQLVMTYLIHRIDVKQEGRLKGLSSLEQQVSYLC